MGATYSKAAMILDSDTGFSSYVDFLLVLSLSLGTVVSISVPPHVGVKVTSLLAGVKEEL